MSDYRHATDRKEVIIHMGCPNGCEFAIDVEAEGTEESIDDLVETLSEEFGDCSECGTSIGCVKQEDPTEVLD